ncbi:MAG: [Oscillospiraceae bacterium]|nr:[citrate (pro-3S)-lyase] ligase [Oscillospiraceae bacterium]
MYQKLTNLLTGCKLDTYLDLLARTGLHYEGPAEQTVLLWEGDCLIATGSRQDNVLKYLAVDPAYQGMDLTAKILTALQEDALQQGHKHLFLYTKPRNKLQFQSLFFYPIAQTKDVLLMENRKNGIRNFLDSLPRPCTEGIIGSAVMNCNPFTLGHQYLIEEAAKDCDHLYVFILSEDKSFFPAKDRLEMARLGTAHLKNVTVLPTGPYLISSATFPTYFLKEQSKGTEVQCALDIAIFSHYYIPHFSITRRYVGSEPLCPVTNAYNQALAKDLPIELKVLPRLEREGSPISASTVRAQFPHISHLVPETTYTYINNNSTLIDRR